MMINDRQISNAEPGSHIMLGMMAPDFDAVTTHGNLKLSGFKGKWVILFSHPADFTPVCTTEFMSFAQSYDEFEKRNVQLIGLSVDSVTSHIAWVRDIEEHMGVHIPFPIIADLDTKVSRLYGMIHAPINTTSPVRSLFIISPDRVIRNIIFYPPGVGRNIKEIIRTIDALQLTEKEHAYTPANWQPGDPVLVSPPMTQAGAEKRTKEHEGLDCPTWYLCKKKL